MIITPTISNAGVFSLFATWSDLDKKELISQKKETVYSSQNILLPKAILNYKGALAVGGGDITIIDNSALASDVGPTGTSVNVNSSSRSSDRIATYIVREGDTLGQIAEMFGVSVGTIIWANDIQKGDLIRKGQVLSILPISGVKHKVSKGETLASIVKKYKGDLKETIQYNNLLDDDTLSIGDEIVVPGGVDVITSPAVNGASSSLAQSMLKNQQNIRGVGGPDYFDYYIRPVSNSRISQGLHGYNAIDFAAPMGTPILASASGTVIISKDNDYWNGGYGNYIVIKHDNGTETLYAHTNSNIVWSGYRVVQGQVIGYVGSTGRSTGPHVHFEVRRAKNPFR